MKTKLKICLFALLMLSLSVMGCMRVEKAVDEYAQTTLKNTVYEDVNNAINAYINKNYDKFSSAVIKEYNSKGELVCIDLDSATINVIKTGLEKEILNAVDDISGKCFYIPLGSLSGIKLLSEKGGKIKMKIAPLGTLTVDAINSFESVGINHTVHKVGFEFKVCFKAAAPFSSKAFETKFCVMICETVIIGKVPDVYVN